MLGASPRDCKFRTCEEFARALRAAVREGPSNKDVVVATETLLRDKLPRAITSQPHEVMQALAQIVEQLLADKEFKSSFGSPPTDAIARGYSQAVRHPVGLLPILSRLRRRGGYALASEAALDLRRIGSNCLTFNVHNGIKAAAPAVKELRRLALRYLGVLDAKLAAFVDTKQFALSDSSWVSGKHEGADVTAVRQQLVGALETIVDGDGMTSFVWPLDNTDFFAKYSEHAAAVGVLGRPVALLEAIEDLHCRLLPSRSGAIALILAPFQTGATVWRALGDAGVASSCDAELQRALQILSADLGIPVKELQDTARLSVGLVPVHRSRPFQRLEAAAPGADDRHTPSPAASTASAARKRSPHPATASRTKSGASARSGSSGRPLATVPVSGGSGLQLPVVPIVPSGASASAMHSSARGFAPSSVGMAYQGAGAHLPMASMQPSLLASRSFAGAPAAVPLAQAVVPPGFATSSGGSGIRGSPGAGHGASHGAGHGAGVGGGGGGGGDDDDDDDYDEDLEALGLKDAVKPEPVAPASLTAAQQPPPKHLAQPHSLAPGPALYQAQPASSVPTTQARAPQPTRAGPQSLPPPPVLHSGALPADAGQAAATPLSRQHGGPPSSASAADAASAASPADHAPQHKRRHTEQVGKSVHLDAVAKANKKAVLAVLKKLEAAKAPVRLGPNAGRLIQPASIFLAPVESTPDFASDYYTKIRKPMDLGTIRCKVVHNEYCLVQDLVADVRLMLANCRTFNKGNEDVLFFADELAKAFENVTKSSKQFQQSGSSFLNPAASNKGTGKPSRFFKYPAAAKGYLQALARMKEAGGGAKLSSSGSRAGSALSAPRSAARHTQQSPMPPPQLMEAEPSARAAPPAQRLGPQAPPPVPMASTSSSSSSARRLPGPSAHAPPPPVRTPGAPQTLQPQAAPAPVLQPAAAAAAAVAPAAPASAGATQAPVRAAAPHGPFGERVSKASLSAWSGHDSAKASAVAEPAGSALGPGLAVLSAERSRLAQAASSQARSSPPAGVGPAPTAAPAHRPSPLGLAPAPAGRPPSSAASAPKQDSAGIVPQPASGVGTSHAAGPASGPVEPAPAPAAAAPAQAPAAAQPGVPSKPAVRTEPLRSLPGLSTYPQPSSHGAQRSAAAPGTGKALASSLATAAAAAEAAAAAAKGAQAARIKSQGPPIAAAGSSAVPVSIWTKTPSAAHRGLQATPRQASGGESVSLNISGARRGASSSTPSASAGPRIAISLHRQSSAASVASSHTGTQRSSVAQHSRKRPRDDASSVASGSSSKRAAIPIRCRPSSSAAAKPEVPDPMHGPLTDLMRRACMRVLSALDKEPVAASIFKETFDSRPKSMAAALRRPELEAHLLAAHKAGQAVHEKSCKVIGELTLPILKAGLTDKGSRTSSLRFGTATHFQAFASRMIRSVAGLYTCSEAKQAVAGSQQGEEIVQHLANQSRRVYWLFAHLWAEHALVEAVRALRRHGSKYPADEPACRAKAAPLTAQVTKLRAEREAHVGDLNLWHQDDAIAILSRHIGNERSMKRHSEVMWAFSDKFSRLFPTVDWPNYESVVGSKPTDLPSVRDRLTFLRRTGHPPLSGPVTVRDIIAETRRVFANCKKFNANQQHMDLEPPTVNFWKLADKASLIAENELGIATVELWWVRESLPKHAALVAKAKAEAGAREEAERLRAESIAARTAARPAPVAPKAKAKPMKAPEETLSGLRQATLGSARDLLEGVTHSALWPRPMQRVDAGADQDDDASVSKALWGAGDGWNNSASADSPLLGGDGAADPHAAAAADDDDDDDAEEDLAWAAGAVAAPAHFGAAGMFASPAEVPAQSATSLSEAAEDTSGAGWSVPLSDEQAAALKQAAAGSGSLVCEACGDSAWQVSVRLPASSSSSGSPSTRTVAMLQLDASVHTALDKTVGRAFTSSVPAAASSMGQLAWSSEAEAATAAADTIRVPSLAVLKVREDPSAASGGWAAAASLVSRSSQGSSQRPALMLKLALQCRGGSRPAGDAELSGECVVPVGPPSKAWRIEPGWAATIEALRSDAKVRPASSARAFGAPDSDARLAAKAAMGAHLASLAADVALVWGGAASDRLLEPGRCIVVPLA